MAWFLYLLMLGILAKGWIDQDGGVSGTWKVCDYMKGGS